jgi:hypothetical protein
MLYRTEGSIAAVGFSCASNKSLFLKIPQLYCWFVNGLYSCMVVSLSLLVSFSRLSMSLAFWPSLWRALSWFMDRQWVVLCRTLIVLCCYSAGANVLLISTFCVPHEFEIWNAWLHLLFFWVFPWRYSSRIWVVIFPCALHAQTTTLLHFKRNLPTVIFTLLLLTCIISFSEWFPRLRLKFSTERSKMAGS